MNIPAVPANPDMLYEDDFTALLGAAAEVVQANRMEVLILNVAAQVGDTRVVEVGKFQPRDALPMSTNQYVGGTLVTVDNSSIERGFEIVSNDSEGHLTIRIPQSAENQPILPKIFQNAQLYPRSNNVLPFTRVDPSASLPEEVYALMQERPDRDSNRFADMYIQPEFSSLNHFDTKAGVSSTHVVSMPHAEINDLQFLNAEKMNGAAGLPNGAGIQAEQYESLVFWAVQYTTAFQGPEDKDGDLVRGNWMLGECDPTQHGVSLIYLETVRDMWHEAYGKAVSGAFIRGDMNDIIARVLVHEIGHQLVATNPPLGGHHYNDFSIMGPGMKSLLDKQFVFNEKAIGYVRDRSDLKWNGAP